jgi:tetratricopeptide (TPR) repeat protein
MRRDVGGIRYQPSRPWRTCGGAPRRPNADVLRPRAARQRAACVLCGLLLLALAVTPTAVAEQASADDAAGRQADAAPSPALAALIADLLKAPDAGARGALLDAQVVAAGIHDEQLGRQTLGHLAIIYRLRGDLDQALDLQRQVLQAFEAAQETAGITHTLNNISILQEQRGEYRDALAAAQRSQGLLQPGTIEYAHALHAIGNIYLSQGDLDLAVDYYQQALTQRDQTPQSKLPTLQMLGEVQRKRHHFDEAAGYLTQARAIAEGSRQQPQVAFALRIEALVRADRGDKAGAVPLLERSLAIGRAIKNPDIISYTLTSLAGLRRELGEPATALALAREAIALGDTQPSRGLAQAYSEAGRAQMALGQRDDARRDLQAVPHRRRGALTAQHRRLHVAPAP